MIERGVMRRAVKWATSVAVLIILSACGGGHSKGEPAGTGSPSQSESALLADTFSIGTSDFNSAACAVEGGRCEFSGERSVAFGASGQYHIKRLRDGAMCDKSTFGEVLVRSLRRCFVAVAVALPVADDSIGRPPPPPLTPPASPAVDSPVMPGNVEAARFLVQATYGPNLAEIGRLARMGYGSWLDEQFAASPMDTHWNYMRRKGPVGCKPCTSNFVNAVMESFWLHAVQGSDQLRQRTALALSEIFVISTVNTSIETIPGAHAAYLDMLSRDAFGSFRTLLEAVATHPAMGAYLSHLKNEKEDPITGRLPDENFAREIMQLFSIGLWELNDDGSRRKDGNGRDIPTYGQAEIMAMAKVFTGYGWGNGDWDYGFTRANPNDEFEKAWNVPMVVNAAHHSAGEKRIIRGVVIPANSSGEQSLKITLDTLFTHPNVGPFIGSQLIQRFITSNPSPAYVKRVSQAFNDNGMGVRGDMRTVIRAVLLDPEARDPARITDPRWGKLREPMIRYANFMRAFDVKSAAGVYRLHNLEDTLSSIGQNPLRAPSVFNWFRPDYAAPGELSKQGLVAPEFQITHETTATGYANFMAHVAARQNTWFRDNVMKQYGEVSEYLAGDYSAEMALAANPGALLDRLNLILTSGQMSASTRKTILEAIEATPLSASDGQTRVAFAVYLILLSPEFIVQK